MLCFLGLSLGPLSLASEKEVVIVKNNWTSQIVLSEILSGIYKKHGIKSRFKKLPVDEQWGELSRGWSDVQVEVWEGTMADKFEKLTSEGKMLGAGTHDAKTREDWWYPLYVKELCPGLPDWKALKKCSSVFATSSSGGKGRYLGGPWEKPDKARVRALGLNFILERAKDSDGLWAALDKAFKKNKPILLFNWTPNWIEHKYKGEFVEFPEYDPKCETDPSWGVSKEWKYDCGNPKNGWLKKASSKRLKESFPCAHEILKRFNFKNEQIAKLAFEVDSNKKDVSKVAARWVKENKMIWENWIPSSCPAKGGKH
ncbi:MAG: glycine/betaine ABC transporter substrate-binding protein [Halobacteriovorax sp.]|nr:glycine/betaine ABC transporter substrate-binding protein [Halobacteriovorax sp.]